MKVHKAGIQTISYATVILAVTLLLSWIFITDSAIKFGILGVAAIVYLLIIQLSVDSL